LGICGTADLLDYGYLVLAAKADAELRLLAPGREIGGNDYEK
jgi:hypothetical protein